MCFAALKPCNRSRPLSRTNAFCFAVSFALRLPRPCELLESPHPQRCASCLKLANLGENVVPKRFGTFISIHLRDTYIFAVSKIGQGGTHHLNEFAVLIGETARGRKGTSWRAIENLIKAVDPYWVASRIRSGFQSGEAIINAVRDEVIGSIPPNKRRVGQPIEVVIDPGVTDKRLMILEEEF